MRDTGGTGTDAGSGIAPRGQVPPHTNPLIADPESLRAEASALMKSAASFADFELAERVLLRALGMDPSDISGQTRYLLGLACFHQERWKDAEMHLAAALRSPISSELLQRVRINLKTGIERDFDPLPGFDPVALRKPAVCAIDPLSLSQPLPPEEKENSLMRLAHAGVSFVAGRIAEAGVFGAWKLRDRKATFDFESWDRRGVTRGLLELGGRRHELNHKLESSYEGILVGDQPPGQARPEWTERFRSATGAWTTDDPLEGAAGTEIQRSGSPLAKRRSRIDDADLPSAREVSRFLLAPQAGRPRREVPFLNLFAIAWIQAQLHDWVSHKPGPAAGARELPLAPDDPLRVRYGIGALRVPLSAANPMPGARPLTYLNEVTHWWDASHLYGSDQQTQDRLRRADGSGELRLEGDLLPVHPKTGIEDTGFTRNWWVGLDLIHTLFVKHHNYICVRLRNNEGDRLRTDDEIFHTARLINSAILAKIHTVEWTPAVLPNRKLVFGMETNWWGLLEAWFKPVSRRRLITHWEPRHPIVGGIAAGRRDNYGKPYAMTDEFTEVYRLHAGIPGRSQGARGNSHSDRCDTRRRGARHGGELRDGEAARFLRPPAHAGAREQQLSGVHVRDERARPAGDRHRHHRHLPRARARGAAVQRVPGNARPESDPALRGPRLQR